MSFVKDVCGIGQGPKCCRYLAMGGDGWACAKMDPVMKAGIDIRIRKGKMKARGDNCEGITNLQAREDATV
jgi:hypothetical protein